MTKKRFSAVGEWEGPEYPELGQIESAVNSLRAQGVTAYYGRADDPSDEPIPPEPPEPPPITASMSKGGVHIVGGNHTYYMDYLTLLAEAGKPVSTIMAMEDGGISEAIAVCPDTITFWRNSIDGNDFPLINWLFTSTEQCKASALDWMSKCYPIWNLNPAKYYLPINEPNPTTQDDVHWMTEWLTYAIEDANPRGYKLCVGGFSAGTPDYWQMEQMLDFVEMCALSGNVIGVHDWAIQSMAPDASLRYRKWDEMLVKAGKARAYYAIVEAYNYMAINQFYWDNWAWYLRELKKDSVCLGACWYTIGDSASINFAGKPLEQYTELQLGI